MKDFLDELDLEVRSITADSSSSGENKESKHLTRKLQERDEKTLKNAPSSEEVGQKKQRPTHSHKSQGVKKQNTQGRKGTKKPQ